jgi:two-component system NtrC family response regulator
MDAVPGTVEQLRAAKQSVLERHYIPIEKAFLQKAVGAAGGNITEAAARVGMKRPNFSTLMKKHGISRKPPKTD